MNVLSRFLTWIKRCDGVATSLVEATATVAIGAVLAGVAVGSAIDAIDNSKVQAAIADVSAIGQAIITFYKDNSFFPLFADGRRTGPNDDYFGFLVSENGTYPTDASLSTPGGVAGAGWDIPGTSGGSSLVTWSAPGYFGDMPDYASQGHATIEGHLVRNILGNPVSSAIGSPGNFYPLRG